MQGLTPATRLLRRRAHVARSQGGGGGVQTPGGAQAPRARMALGAAGWAPGLGSRHSLEPHGDQGRALTSAARRSEQRWRRLQVRGGGGGSAPGSSFPRAPPTHEGRTCPGGGCPPARRCLSGSATFRGHNRVAPGSLVAAPLGNPGDHPPSPAQPCATLPHAHVAKVSRTPRPLLTRMSRVQARANSDAPPRHALTRGVYVHSLNSG